MDIILRITGRRRRIERNIVRRLRKLNATDSSRAKELKDLDLQVDPRVLQRLLSEGVIREIVRVEEVKRDGKAVNERVLFFYLDEATLSTYRRTRIARYVMLAVVGIHLIGALAACAYSMEETALTALFRSVRLDSWEFFSQLLICGMLAYSLLLAFWLLDFAVSSYWRWTAAGTLASFAVALILSADYAKRNSNPSPVGAHSTTMPSTGAGFFYSLLTDRQPMLVLGLLATLVTVAVIYFVIRSLLSVERKGASFQIRLPGQTVYFVPLYPQISWQNTGITLKKDERVDVELSGYVSPGAFQNVVANKDYLEKLLEVVQKTDRAAEDLTQLPEIVAWDYTGPEGYPPDWYRNPKKRVLELHPLYKQDRYYRHDVGLTVMGLPHNVVLGLIRAPGEELPRQGSMIKKQPGYNYEDPQTSLLYLSSAHYPMTITANRTGELWVVINDVDDARWDNGGMFFMRVIKRGWLAAHHVHS